MNDAVVSGADVVSRRLEVVGTRYVATQTRLRDARSVAETHYFQLEDLELRVAALKRRCDDTRLALSRSGDEITNRDVLEFEAVRNEYAATRAERADCRRRVEQARGTVARLETRATDLFSELRYLERDLERGREIVIEKPVLMRLSGMSRRLASCASRLLPVGVRSDYEERFQSELFELADSGLGRWRQVRHSLRVLVRAPSLRWVLRHSPVRERSW